MKRDPRGLLQTARIGIEKDSRLESYDVRTLL